MAKFCMIMLQRKLAGWEPATDRGGDKGRKTQMRTPGPGIKEAGWHILMSDISIFLPLFFLLLSYKKNYLIIKKKAKYLFN